MPELKVKSFFKQIKMSERLDTQPLVKTSERISITYRQSSKVSRSGCENPKHILS